MIDLKQIFARSVKILFDFKQTNTYRMCWVQGGSEGGTGPDSSGQAVAHLVLQVSFLRCCAAWRVHGQVSTNSTGLS